MQSEVTVLPAVSEVLPPGLHKKKSCYSFSKVHTKERLTYTPQSQSEILFCCWVPIPWDNRSKSYLWLPVVMPSSNQQNPWGWNFSYPGANGTILIASSSTSSTEQLQVSFFQRNQEFFALELCLSFSQGHQLHTY